MTASVRLTSQPTLRVTMLGWLLIACAAPEPAHSPPRANESSPIASAPASPAQALPISEAAAGGAGPEALSLPVVPPSAPALEPSIDRATEQRPSRSPIDVLTAPDTAFLINYTGSDLSEVARRACAGKADASDEAVAQCLSDARASFKADVLRFKPAAGHWSCTIFKRDGSRLDELYSARVDLSEELPNRVKIKFSGAEKGVRPVLKNKREVAIEVPNDYSLLIDDSELGRLLYEAKIGLVGR